MTTGELLFIGLGLFDNNDISLKGLKELQSCEYVFAEFYTAQLTGTTKKHLEQTIGKPIQILSRAETENSEIILLEGPSYRQRNK